MGHAAAGMDVLDLQATEFIAVEAMIESAPIGTPFPAKEV
jgi:hypothetical protein